MSKILKIAVVAFCISMHSNSNAMYGPRNDDYVGPVLSGMVAGWAYERLLYRLPILLGIPTATGALFFHALNSIGYSDSQTNVTACAALATALGLYMCEKPQNKQEVVVIHHSYRERHEHHGHGHHGHHHD